VQLLRETTDGLSVRYSIDQLDYQEIDTPQGKFTDFNIQHYASTNQSGMPRLPLQRQIIAVPEGATVAPRIVNARRQTISLASRGIHYPIMPRQESVSKSADLSKISFEVNRDFYNRSIWTDYPSVSVEEIGYMRGVRLFALAFAPVRYNPALGEIEVILDVSGYAYGDAFGEHKTILMAKQSQAWKRQGKKVILLPQALGPSAAGAFGTL